MEMALRQVSRCGLGDGSCSVGGNGLLSMQESASYEISEQDRLLVFLLYKCALYLQSVCPKPWPYL